jgi:hypothetical protein
MGDLLNSLRRQPENQIHETMRRLRWASDDLRTALIDLTQADAQAAVRYGANIAEIRGRAERDLPFAIEKCRSCQPSPTGRDLTKQPLLDTGSVMAPESDPIRDLQENHRRIRENMADIVQMCRIDEEEAGIDWERWVGICWGVGVPAVLIVVYIIVWQKCWKPGKSQWEVCKTPSETARPSSKPKPSETAHPSRSESAHSSVSESVHPSVSDSAGPTSTSTPRRTGL